jgi:hypothetical protein
MDVGGIKFLPGDHDQFADQSLTQKKNGPSPRCGFAPGAPNHPNHIQSQPSAASRDFIAHDTGIEEKHFIEGLRNIESFP